LAEGLPRTAASEPAQAAAIDLPTLSRDRFALPGFNRLCHGSMPRRNIRPFCRLASLSFAILALTNAPMAQGQIFTGSTAPKTVAPGANPADKNVVLTADLVTEDDVNNTVSATGHVELVQGAEMLLAERVIWNKTTDIVTATGDVKLVNDTGDIYFGDYLEITSDMRQAFMTNVSGLLSDNSRLVGRQAEKDGGVMTLNRSIYSPCELCASDPSQPPTWQIKAVKVIHDSDAKRIYYHDATFTIEDIPIAWTPYFSTYDPSVKRAEGFLETLPGYKSQLGMFLKTSYYFDLAPDMDAVLDGGYFSHQGPMIGGQFRERFDTGLIQLSGSLTESDIRQYPTPINQDEKTIRGHIFATGEFDLSDEWRAGFQLARTEDDIYVLKYGYSGLQVLPEHVYAEGFYDRGYINVSLWSFQDLRANIDYTQPHALPYATYSFFGDPGETLGGRWSDSGSLMTIQTYPGEGVERLANNIGWSSKLVNDMGLVTVLNASAETDYYWTQDIQPDPITDKTTAKTSAGRFFPQAYAVVSYPLARQLSYAQWVVEPIMSLVAAPSNANNQLIPNQDSQDVQLNVVNLFSGNRYPGIDRIDDGSRVTYGVRTGLYNLGTGYTTLFLGQSYRITGDTIFPPDSGLQTRFSDLVGELDVAPGKLIDINYEFEWSNDLRTDRVQEVNFRIGPDQYGFTGTYLFAGSVVQPNFTATERNELQLGFNYRFNDHWSMNTSSTTELSHPRAVLRYGLSGGYNDDCSTLTLNIAHDQTLPVGGTSGTAVFIQFSLKNLGVFRSPSIH
jgi:LPS-assembly protein